MKPGMNFNSGHEIPFPERRVLPEEKKEYPIACTEEYAKRPDEQLFIQIRSFRFLSKEKAMQAMRELGFHEPEGDNFLIEEKEGRTHIKIKSPKGTILDNSWEASPAKA